MTAGQATGGVARRPLELVKRALLVAAAIGLAVLGWLAWSWFRDSPLVEVRHVEVSGLSTTRDAPRIRAALRDAATGMTTLHVRPAELKAAVEPFAEVRTLSVSSSFPSTLKIEVAQREPVAAITAGKRRVAVAGDGTLLPASPAAKLATVSVTALPHGGAVEGRARILVFALAGAPAALRPKIGRAYTASDGIRVALEEGPVIRFGRPERMAAKWAAAARVLAAPSSAGAEVIDVRLPERPAASGFGGAAPSETIAEPSAAAANGATPSAPATAPGSPTPGATTTAPEAAPAAGGAPPAGVPGPATAAPAAPAGTLNPQPQP